MSVSFSPVSVLSRARVPLAATLLATGAAAHGMNAPAQDGSDSSESQKDLSALTKGCGDFIHYVLIGKADLAQAAPESVLGGCQAGGAWIFSAAFTTAPAAPRRLLSTSSAAAERRRRSAARATA